MNDCERKCKQDYSLNNKMDSSYQWTIDYRANNKVRSRDSLMLSGEEVALLSSYFYSA